jgi:N-acetyl-alpha-D-muramate 1-phosphate uridylyltransferase
LQPTELPVAILAGGLATRLRPTTARIPKSLVPVAGEPFLSHQLRLLRANGLRRVVLCVGYLGEMIEADFGTGAAFDMELGYAYDGPTLLGTGGAIRHALPLLGEAFYVLYGDSYLPMDYAAAAEAWRASGQPGLMTVFRNAGSGEPSNVEFAEGRIVRYDKKNPSPAMQHIDYGLSVFHREAFASFPEGEAIDLATIQRSLADAGRLAAYEVAQRYYEIGSPAGLAELDRFLTPL